jgi:hypothetical protein
MRCVHPDLSHHGDAHAPKRALATKSRTLRQVKVVLLEMPQPLRTMFRIIDKSSRQWRVQPNLVDYEAQRRSFDWQSACKTLAMADPLTKSSLPRLRGRRMNLRLFLLLRQQFDDPGGSHRNVVSALGEDVVIARHADDHVFQVGQARPQNQDFGDFDIVEVTEKSPHVA